MVFMCTLTRTDKQTDIHTDKQLYKLTVTTCSYFYIHEKFGFE